MLADPVAAPLAPFERALAGLAALVSEAPWTLGPDDHARARAAGLSDATILQTVLLSAFFNYLNRIADGIDLEYDYETALPPLVKDAARPPVPRPPRADWPAGGALPLRLADRPATAAAFARWQAYLLGDRATPTSPRARRVIAHAAAAALCDARTVDALADHQPRDAAEQRLARYAGILTATPWRVTRDDLDALRKDGHDDRALLDVIAVVSFQNTASRLALALQEFAP